MKGKRSVFYIFLLSDRKCGTEHQYLLSRFLGVSILQLLIIYSIDLRVWYVDVVAVITEVVCLTFQTSGHENYGTWSELISFETSELGCRHIRRRITGELHVKLAIVYVYPKQIAEESDWIWLWNVIESWVNEVEYLSKQYMMLNTGSHALRTLG